MWENKFIFLILPIDFMNINNLDFNLLKVFKAIYEEQNVTLAGKKIGLTQPAMSNALSRLRDVFKGDPLFIKSPKGMIATNYGDHLYRDVKKVFNVLVDSIQEPRDFNPYESKRTFCFTMSDYNQLIILPKLISFLSKENLSIKIHVESVPTNEIAGLLESRQLDLAIGGPINIGKYLNDNFCQSPLYNENYVCISHESLISKDEVLNQEKYLSLDHLAVSPSEKRVEKIDHLLSQHGYDRNISLTVPHFQVVPRIVSTSSLVATVGSRLAKVSANIYPIKVYPVPFNLPGYEICQYWHKQSDADPANQWIRYKIQSFFSSNFIEVNEH